MGLPVAGAGGARARAAAGAGLGRHEAIEPFLLVASVRDRQTGAPSGCARRCRWPALPPRRDNLSTPKLPNARGRLLVKGPETGLGKLMPHEPIRIALALNAS